MSNRNHEKMRKQMKQTAADMRVNYPPLDENFRIACTRDLACPSTGQHLTGCRKLAADLKRLKDARR